MKFVEMVKTHAWKILTFIFLLGFIGRGCTSSKIAKTNKALESHNEVMVKTVDSLTTVITTLEDKVVGSKETRDIMEKVMLNYLIYEDDLDKGKISLSQIKDKIEKND